MHVECSLFESTNTLLEDHGLYLACVRVLSYKEILGRQDTCRSGSILGD